MNIFVSYTTRDNEVTRSMLRQFSSRLASLGSVYVDILDNDSIEKQRRVLSELDASDLLILIESSGVRMSPWVALELERAKANQTAIHAISYNDFKTFLNTNAPMESVLPQALLPPATSRPA